MRLLLSRLSLLLIVFLSASHTDFQKFIVAVVALFVLVLSFVLEYLEVKEKGLLLKEFEDITKKISDGIMENYQEKKSGAKITNITIKK